MHCTPVRSLSLSSSSLEERLCCVFSRRTDFFQHTSRVSSSPCRHHCRPCVDLFVACRSFSVLFNRALFAPRRTCGSNYLSQSSASSPSPPPPCRSVAVDDGSNPHQLATQFPLLQRPPHALFLLSFPLLLPPDVSHPRLRPLSRRAVHVLPARVVPATTSANSSVDSARLAGSALPLFPLIFRLYLPLSLSSHRVSILRSLPRRPFQPSLPIRRGQYPPLSSVRRQRNSVTEGVGEGYEGGGDQCWSVGSECDTGAFGTACTLFFSVKREREGDADLFSCDDEGSATVGRQVLRGLPEALSNGEDACWSGGSDGQSSASSLSFLLFFLGTS
jgi:hypothetical protein